jgi:hypothetical protein
VQHVGPHALKVACPRQLDCVVKLLLGKSIDRAVFHEHGTVARGERSSVAAKIIIMG